jgi:glycosyltransferase involved in cell wall biosynthesis
MPYRLGFVMEQTLGHVTHAENFRQWIARDPDVVPTWIPISFEMQDRWDLVPLIKGNWTVRASLRARAQLHDALRSEELDGLFFHTQVTALFAQALMARIPSVVSMDATPLNFDSIGQPYNHNPSAYRYLETLKNRLTKRTFRGARKLITWHEWGKESLVREYQVDAEKVVVLPPGIDLDRWNFPRPNSPPAAPVRLLFVGGDFRRKGGEILLKAFRKELMDDCELDIVTRETVNIAGLRNVRVHHGLGPNAANLMDLYARADVFVFPTFGDTLPIVLMEAMASGLPIVTTTVGAINEEVEHGVTGLLIEAGDAGRLAEATLSLVRNPELRRKMGVAGRCAADRLFNGSQNYPHVLAVCKSCVDDERRR